MESTWSFHAMEGTSPVPKEEAVAMDQPESSTPSGTHIAARPGIEERHVVLEQFRTRSADEIIALDTDDSDDSLSTSSTVRSTQSQIVEETGSMPRLQVIERRHIPSSLLHGTPTENTSSGGKKKLFQSAIARQRMQEMAGMLTPPYDVSPNSSFSEPDVQTTEDGPEESEESIMEKVMADYYASHEQVEDIESDNRPETDPAVAARTLSEAEGMARSQRLRAERGRRADLLKERAADTEEWQEDSPSVPADRARFLHSNRRSPTPAGQRDRDSRDEREAEAAWALFDDATRSTTKPQHSKDAPGQPLRTKFNAYSRQAAETFRTQSRHLEDDDEDDETYYQNLLIKGQSPPPPTEEEEQELAEHKARVKARAFGRPYPQPSRKRPSKDDIQHPRPTKRQRFHAPDLKSTKVPKSSAKPTVPVMNGPEIRKVMGVEDAAIEDSDTEKPKVSFAALGNLSQNRTQATSIAAGTITDDSHFPEQGTVAHLTLPKNFDALSTHRQQLTLKREVAKERERDLTVIQKCFQDFARLMSLSAGVLEGQSPAEIHELRIFTQAVLEKQLCGKPHRKRLGDILGNLKRRTDRAMQTTGITPDEGAMNDQLGNILPQKWFDLLRDEMLKVQQQATGYMIESKRLTNDHYKQKQKKKPSGGATFKSQKAQQLAELQSTFELFEAAEKRANQSSSSQDEPVLTSEDHEDDENISEEDDDLGPSPSRPQKSAYGIEEEVEIEMPTKKPVSHQAQSESLLERMAARANQKKHARRQGVQQADNDMLEEQRARNSQREEEAEASDDSASSDTTDVDQGSDQAEYDDLKDEEGVSMDCNNSPLAKRYIVRMQTNGFETFDEYELVQGHFLDQEKAVAAAKLQLTGLLAKKGLVEHSALMHRSSRDTEIYEEVIEFSDELGARVWVDEELHPPSKKALENAEVRAACRPLQIWIVEWQKTFEPIVPDDTDSLFGESTNEDEPAGTPAQKPNTITERSAAKDMALFMNLRLANQYAMQEYQSWYSDHCPGVENSEYLKMTFREMDESLEKLAADQCWRQENSFEVEKEGMGKVTETYKIEVVKAKSFGPSN